MNRDSSGPAARVGMRVGPAHPAEPATPFVDADADDEGRASWPIVEAPGAREQMVLDWSRR